MPMDERQTAQEPESGLILGSIRGRLVRGSAWVLAGRILSIVAGVAVNALLSRILTPAELGDYFLAFTIVLFASTLAELGMDIAIVRFVAGAIGIRQFGQARAAIRAVLRCVLVATLAVMAVMALGPGHLLATHVFHSTALAQIMGLASLWTAGLVFRSIFAEAFRGMHDLRFATLFEGLLTTILM